MKSQLFLKFHVWNQERYSQHSIQVNFRLNQHFKVNQNFDFTDRHFIEFGYFNLEE